MGAGRGLQQPPGSCKEQLPGRRRNHQDRGGQSLPQTPGPPTPRLRRHTLLGSGALLWGARGELDGDLAGPAPSPDPLPRRAQPGCGVPAHIQPPGFLRTCCSRKVTGENSGPRLDFQGQELLLVLLPTRAGLGGSPREATTLARPGGPPPPQLLQDPTGPTGSHYVHFPVPKLGGKFRSPRPVADQV